MAVRGISDAVRGLLREVDQAPLFHGTGSPWINDVLRKVRPDPHSASNLYGPGLYMTGNRHIAKEYVDKNLQQYTEGIRYGLEWRHKPNLINLDKPLPGKVLKHFEETFHPTTRHYYTSALERDAPDHIGREVYGVFRRFVKPDEQFQLTRTLRAEGYHGFQHEGGHIVNWADENYHRVNIAFDPENDLRLLGHERVLDPINERIARNQETIKDIQARIDNPDSVYMRGGYNREELVEDLGYAVSRGDQLARQRTGMIEPTIRANVERSRAIRRAIQAERGDVRALRGIAASRSQGLPSRVQGLRRTRDLYGMR